MLINVMLVKKHVHQTVLWLHATAVDCAHELIYVEAGKILQNQ